MHKLFLILAALALVGCTSSEEKAERAYLEDYNENRTLGQPEILTEQQYHDRVTGKNKYERAADKTAKGVDNSFWRTMGNTINRTVSNAAR